MRLIEIKGQRSEVKYTKTDLKKDIELGILTGTYSDDKIKADFTSVVLASGFNSEVLRNVLHLGTGILKRGNLYTDSHGINLVAPGGDGVVFLKK